jgi:hypothetical protein
MDTKITLEQLARHVETLGGVDGGSRPFSDTKLDELSALIGAPLYPALRWWWTTYGAINFVEPVGWGGPPEALSYLFGYGLDEAEIMTQLDDFEGTLGPHRIPLNDDSSGNFLVVDPGGAVYYHIHDAYLDRNEPRIADSFEQFVLMLQRGQ